MKFDVPITLKQAADELDCRFKGDPDFYITGINEIHMVATGDITFVDHPKYYKKVLESAASVVIINSEEISDNGKALIFSKDPFASYVSLVRKFSGFMPATQAICPSAQIGANSIIQPGAFIGNNVTIGNNCIIHSNVSIYDNTLIGDDVIIHANTVIGADAYYFQHRPEGYRKLESCGRVILGNRVEIGALCSIDRGVSGDTIIGEGTKFDNHVQVGHDTRIGKNCLIGAHTAIAGVTTIEDDVIIWARVVVNKDIVVGKGAVILATSGLDKSVEGGKTYFGSPALEARLKWREMVALKQLPDFMKSFEKKEE